MGAAACLMGKPHKVKDIWHSGFYVLWGSSDGPHGKGYVLEDIFLLD
jgi:hypothetical protein